MYYPSTFFFFNFFLYLNTVLQSSDECLARSRDVAFPTDFRPPDMGYLREKNEKRNKNSVRTCHYNKHT